MTEALAAAGGEGGIVGGVAVFLHGYRRTTVDVDVFTPDSAGLKVALENAGFVWSVENREFYYRGGSVPVQVLTDDVVIPPRGYSVIKGINVIGLADLLSMKLDSGTRDLWNLKDVADVVRLVQVLNLDGGLAPQLHPSARQAYRELLDRLERGGPWIDGLHQLCRRNTGATGRPTRCRSTPSSNARR